MEYYLQPHMVNPLLLLFLGSPLEAASAWEKRIELALHVEPFTGQRLSRVYLFYCLPFQGSSSESGSVPNQTQDEQPPTGFLTYIFLDLESRAPVPQGSFLITVLSVPLFPSPSL